MVTSVDLSDYANCKTFLTSDTQFDVSGPVIVEQHAITSHSDGIYLILVNTVGVNS